MPVSRLIWLRGISVLVLMRRMGTGKIFESGGESPLFFPFKRKIEGRGWLLSLLKTIRG